MYITAQGCRLRNDLYCVEWDVKTLLYHTTPNGDNKLILFMDRRLHVINLPGVALDSAAVGI